MLARFLAAGLLLAPLADAQTVKPENRNAALQYATVFYTANPDMMKKAEEVDIAQVGFDKAKAPAVFLEASELIAKNGDQAVTGLLEASRLSKCDFELAMEKGIMVLMPHLGKMRGAVRLLRVDARRHLLDGDPTGAAERLGAMVRMGRHATNDHILISALVGAAIVNA